VLVAIVVAVGPGCLQADYGYELTADGGGTVELQIRFRDELVRTLEQLGLGDVVRGDVSIVEDQLDRLPAGWRERIDVESVEDGAGIDVSIRFDDLEQLEELRTIGDIGVPVVTRTEGRWRVDLDFTSMVGAAGTLAPAADELTSSDLGSVLSDALGALAGEPELVVRVTMPGEITGADAAAEVDGRTATWTVVADAAGVGFVESGTGPAGFLAASVGGAPLWGLLLLGVVVAAAVVVVVARSRRGDRMPALAGPGPVSRPGPAPWEHVPPTSAAVPPLGGWAPIAPVTPQLPPSAPTAPLALPPLPGPVGPGSSETAPVPVVDEPTEVLAAVPVGGWHPDPWGRATWRWWDGREWTEHTA